MKATESLYYQTPHTMAIISASKYNTKFKASLHSRAPIPTYDMSAILHTILIRVTNEFTSFLICSQCTKLMDWQNAIL